MGKIFEADVFRDLTDATYKAPFEKSFNDVEASTWVEDSTYSDYGYKCELSITGVLSTDYASVTFAHEQAISGNYSPICLTSTDKVTIYSKVNDSITISNIIIKRV
jgi:hypothetical protein